MLVSACDETCRRALRQAQGLELAEKAQVEPLSRVDFVLRISDPFVLNMRLWLAPHLAQLKKVLRMAGLDTRIWKKGVGGFEPEDRVVQSVRYPLPVKGVTVVSLVSVEKGEQLREVFNALAFKPDRTDLLGRCIRCNHPLKRLNSEDLACFQSRIPIYIRQTQRHFSHCERCTRIYWQGTHARNMIRRMEESGIICRNLPDAP